MTSPEPTPKRIQCVPTEGGETSPTEWRDCTPELLASGVDCATTPRRPGHGPDDPGPLVISHQHLVNRGDQ